MEGGVPGTEGRRLQCLAATAHSAAPAHAVQPPRRSVRAGPARVGRLRAVVRRACLRARPRAGDRGAASVELSGLSATPKARFLLSRTSHGETEESAVQ